MTEDKDILLTEYKENMTTYRYLTEMTVKYMLVYLGILGFCVKAYFDLSKENPPDWIEWLLYFAGGVGVYTFFTIILVMWRMRGIQNIIKDNTDRLEIHPQKFWPLFAFLILTAGVILISAIISFILPYLVGK